MSQPTQPIPTPVEASGFAPFTGGLEVVPSLLFWLLFPALSPGLMVAPPSSLPWYSNVQVTVVPSLEAANTSFESDAVLSSFQSDGTFEIFTSAPLATL